MGFDEEAVARKRQGLQVQKIISIIVCVSSPILLILGIAILATQDGASYPIVGGSPIYVGVYGFVLGCIGIIANSVAIESITTQEETAKQRNLWNGFFGLLCASFGVLGYPSSEVIRGAISCAEKKKECGNSHQDTLMALFIVASILVQVINCSNIILLCYWRKFRGKTSQGPCVTAKTSPPKYT
ncbi:uncharacterized protein LOC127737420 [Mytilus californianus]|uniref:uncharacterized protein LOC127737420 n=1 Tax=Mytilus californianus TaxID=6549 RepID=UPI0022481FAF|nr:uncharacterized protein LOC127737420 [Mytilus californianus]